jgi:hypothetical protein
MTAGEPKAELPVEAQRLAHVSSEEGWHEPRADVRCLRHDDPLAPPNV